MNRVHQRLWLPDLMFSRERQCCDRCLEQEIDEFGHHVSWMDVDGMVPRFESRIAAEWWDLTLSKYVLGWIKENQQDDPKMAKIFEQINRRPSFEVVSGVLHFRGILCVPDVDRLREKIMIEPHHTYYSIHPRSTKMFQNLKDRCWWNNMKQEIARFCLSLPFRLAGENWISEASW